MALSGTLETFSLPDVLRLLASTKKTGLLTLSGDRGLGRVWVDEGAIVAADSDNGEEIDGVVFDLLRYREGSFDFDAGSSPTDDAGEPRPVEECLDAAEALLDQWKEIEAVVPSLDVYVRLVDEIDHEVTIGASQWRLLARVGAGASGHRIACQLELGEFDVCRQLKELVDRDLVEIDEQPDGVDQLDHSAQTDTEVQEAPVDHAVGDEDGIGVPGSSFEAPDFAADTIGSEEWTPPETIVPEAVTDHDTGSEPGADGEPADHVEPATAIEDDADVPTFVSPALSEDEVSSLSADLATFVVGASSDAASDSETERESDVDDLDDVEDTPDAPVEELVAEREAEPDIGTLPEVDAGTATSDEEEFLSQLSGLSPKAAKAIEATASADERGPDRDADDGDDFLSSLAPSAVGAPDAVADVADEDLAIDGGALEEVDGEDRDINQNLLLRFLSSTKQ